MCIRIRVSAATTRAVVWDPLEVCVLVRAGAEPVPALREVAAVLADLGAQRTWSGFRCFCGEPLLLPAELAGDADSA